MRISKFSTVPRYVKVPDAHSLVSLSEPTKSIVGSVTTWFPPSTTIQLNSNNSPPKNPLEAVQAPRPQSITIMGDRKYLIVPKHSILSVSPTIGAALSTPASRRLTSPTADKAPNVVSDKDKNEASVDLSMLDIPASASLGPAIPPDVSTEQSSAENEPAPLPTELSDPPEAGTPTPKDSPTLTGPINDAQEDITPADPTKE